jgi:ribosomal protein L9
MPDVSSEIGYPVAMAKLQNRRHEIFATELAAGAPLLSAYLSAGYKESYSARFNASRLKNTSKVRARIDELQVEFSRSTFVRLEWIQHQLVDIIEGRAASVERIDADNKKVIERDRIGALTALARTIGGFAVQVDLKAEITGELAVEIDALNAVFMALTPDDQRIFMDGMRAFAEERRSEVSDAALPAPDARSGDESARAPATSHNRNSPPQSTALAPAASPAPPPESEPPRQGRVRFIQFARMRAGGGRPLAPEFSSLRSDVRRSLLQFVSPVPGDSTWPASPVDVVDALERLAPVEINELLNMMVGQSPTLQGFEVAP